MRNRTILVGDNLHVMRRMDSDCVDLIYLDPPFNTNREYHTSAHVSENTGPGCGFSDKWTVGELDTEEVDKLENESPLIHKFINLAGLMADKSTMAYLAFMSPRLIEMKRLLKHSGSIYLHCDQTASHYLKVVMDLIFGHHNYKSEITWKRTFANNSGNNWSNIRDIILYYGTGVLNDVRTPMTLDYAMTYNMTDHRGRYKKVVLTAPEPRSGSHEWRGYDPASVGRSWSAPSPAQGAYGRWLAERIDGYAEADTYGRLELLEANDFIVWSKNDTPYVKWYLEANEGKSVDNLWTDIHRVTNRCGERLGYPTQKPVALLERIIQASSNPGDMVLDPFCGSGTTCFAAEKLGRHWVGMDLSEKAGEITHRRIGDYLGMFDDTVIERTAPPPARADSASEGLRGS